MAILLAIDCSANLCAACAYDTLAGRELGRSVFDLGKGHAEHLMAVIGEALKQGSLTYKELGAVAVSVGPGSFTGVRVGVSTARGLALALKIPAIGVTTLEALAAEAQEKFPHRPVLVALDGGRGEIHAALYDRSMIVRYGPAVATLPEMVGMAVREAPVLAGTQAEKIADAAEGATFEVASLAATADIGIYARRAVVKGEGEKPHPLYLRAADAKPQAGFILPRVS